MNPDKKYILLAVSGETPQIITETFFKLKETGYDIQEIHVITTVRGKNNLMGLLSDNPDENVFLKMCREYDWEPLTVKEQNIHVFSDQKGGFLEDIRTDEEERCAADFIFKTTRDLMELRSSEDDGEGYAIVASIAGGRKTMSYLMGSTMSILGRDDDELTHVLVDPRYERLDRSSPKFFYPTRESRPLLNADREEIDARDAKIDLSFIPFIKLGHILKDSEKGKQLIANSAETAYSDAVSAINYELSVNPDDIQLWVDYRKLNLSVRNTRTGEHFDIQLDALEMAFYRMLLDNLKNPGSVTKPSHKNSIQELFRYWLRLYSFTPLPRESEVTRKLVSDINDIIAKIRARKCLAESEDGKNTPKTSFYDIYETVVEIWKDYASNRDEHGINTCGMGQECNLKDENNNEKTPKKDNLLNYIGNETAFKQAHINNWKKIQDDKVNSKIKQSGCPDAIQELLKIKCRTIPGKGQTYSIALKWDQVAMPGYDPLPFAELDVPDEQLALRHRIR
ncbi:CRISPR-associated ring nuclease Csm6 [Succinimonas sp.]|uniref:CRISPR-associated ring nuclease Csm6 n=1 Tax=Succinimonas sp. TaxID=1936151 RepID=UPI0038687E00